MLAEWLAYTLYPSLVDKIISHNWRRRFLTDGDKLQTLQSVWKTLYNAWEAELVQPRMRHLDWYQHIFRERNTKADALTNRARETNLSQPVFNLYPDVPFPPKYLRAFFDGGLRDDVGTFGWLLEGATSRDTEGDPVWFHIADLSARSPLSSVPALELLAASEVAHAAVHYLSGCLAIDSCTGLVR